MEKNATDKFRVLVAQAIEELKNKKHGGALWKAVLKRAEELSREDGKRIRTQDRSNRD